MKKSCSQSASPSLEKVKSHVSITESDYFFTWQKKMLFLKNYPSEMHYSESLDSTVTLCLTLQALKINLIMKSSSKWENMKNWQVGTVTNILFSKPLAKNSKEKYIIFLKGMIKNCPSLLVLIIKRFWLNKSLGQ